MKYIPCFFFAITAVAVSDQHHAHFDYASIRRSKSLLDNQSVVGKQKDDNPTKPSCWLKCSPLYKSVARSSLKYFSSIHLRRRLEGGSEDENQAEGEQGEEAKNEEGEEYDEQYEEAYVQVSENTSNYRSPVVITIATLMFTTLAGWFLYHCYIEQLQEQRAKVQMEDAKTDLLKSTTTATEDSVAIFNQERKPVDGTYCAVYLEPNSDDEETDIERKYEMNLRFRESAGGWKIFGNGIDPNNEMFTVVGGFVTSTGKACWTEVRDGPTVLCNGQFNFFTKTFQGAWLARNGAGGEYVRFYHKSLSTYRTIESHETRGDDSVRTDNETCADDTYATQDDQSRSIIDVEDPNVIRKYNSLDGSPYLSNDSLEGTPYVSNVQQKGIRSKSFPVPTIYLDSDNRKSRSTETLERIQEEESADRANERESDIYVSSSSSSYSESYSALTSSYTGNSGRPLNTSQPRIHARV